MSTRLCTLALLLTLVGLTPTQADTLYVDDDALPGGDGTTWLSAFNDLQLALDAAKVSRGTITEIHVAAGTYRPTAQFEPGIPRTESFQLINNVALKGGYRGCPDGDCTGDPDERDITQYETILSGDLEGNDIEEDFPDGPTYEDNSLHVIYLPKQLALNETAILDGCTVTGGHANTEDGVGGGIYCQAAGPTIRDCAIVRNFAEAKGGGVSCETGDLVIVGTTISHNRSTSGGGVACFLGGSLLLSACDVEGNRAYYGAGMHLTDLQGLRIEDSIIAENRGERSGGIRVSGCERATIERCTICRNVSIYSYGSGAGIACYSCSPDITNCLLVGNVAERARDLPPGGAIFCWSESFPRITNCTIAFNTSEGGAAVSCHWDCVPELTNCIIWGNVPQSVCAVNDWPIISYSNVEGGYEGSGNINVDPLFAFEANPRLMPGSPCIDAGKNDLFSGFPEEDLERLPRTIDGNDDTDARIDMGAYEFDAGAPTLAVSADKIECFLSPEETLQHTETLQVRNTGGDTLNWDVHEDCPWLTVSPQSGTSSGEVNEVTLNVDMTDLAFGQHECTLTIAGTEALNAPRIVRVILHVFDTLNVPAEFGTIQEAIDAAHTHDVVLIADGIYTGPGNRDLDFLGKAITVRSENGPEACIIDCEHQSRGVVFHRDEGWNSRLEGLTIRCGYGHSETIESSSGGGIFCIGSSPTIAGCIVTDSFSDGAGGGIGAYGSGRPVIVDCLVSNNATSYRGGGIGCWHYAAPIIRRCTIRGNRSATNGGGITVMTQPVLITGCKIEQNVADVKGGGIYYSSNGESEIVNCVFSGNVAAVGAAIDYDNGFGATIANCTIVHNRASGRSAGIQYDGPALNLTNCILRGNFPKEIVFTRPETTAIPNVTYCNIEGRWEGEGNIDVDPLFTFDGDYRLAPGSPCIDAGSNEWIPMPTPTDFDGNPRLQDGDGDGFSCVDIGAFEFNTLEPTIAISTELIEVDIPVDDSSLRTAALNIRNCGGGTLHWQIDEDADWLTVNTPSGSSGGEVDEVTLTIDPSGMGHGTHECPVVISGSEIVGRPRLLRVLMNIHDILRVPSQYATIEAAVEASRPHDVILLADGLYLTNEPEGIAMGDREITIRSENGPEECIIDGQGKNRVFLFSDQETKKSGWTRMADLPAAGCRAHVTDSSFLYPKGAILEGLTIQNGYSEDGNGGGILCEVGSPTVRNCVIQQCEAREGGGIALDGTGCPTIEDCRITENFANSGGGAYCDSAGVIRDSEISFNQAYSGGGVTCHTWGYTGGGALVGCLIYRNSLTGWHGYGGGLFSDCSSTGTFVRDCTISGNSSTRSGGGVYAKGGGVFLDCRITDNSAPTSGGGIYVMGSGLLRSCKIVGNYAEASGGGLFHEEYAIYPCELVTIDCDFVNNKTDGIGGGIFGSGEDTSHIVAMQCNVIRNTAVKGGGAYFGVGEMTVLNAVIEGNEASERGGAFYLDSGSTTLIHCTVTNNTAGQSGGGFYLRNALATVRNSIFWKDLPSPICIESGNGHVRYSLVQEGWEGEGNINADPLFLDPDGPDDDPATWEDNDFRLAAGSPCIDAANNLAVPLDEFDLDGDGDRTERIPFDLAGFARFIDDTATPDTGIADPPAYPEIVDIGAYEFHPADWLLGDLNCDDERTAADIEPFILALLAPDAYATAFPDCNRARADLNADGAVNGPDIAEFVQELLHPE